MAPESCPLPRTPDPDEASAIHKMLHARRIAVVGLSDDPARPSFGVAQYLADHGYEIIPVNPTHPTIMGRPSYSSVSDVPGTIDVVLVFRRPEAVPPIAHEAVAAKAGGLWLQAGIRSDQARQLAQAAGMPFIQDRCMMVEHGRRG